jgi:hypothetical protein
LIVETALIPGPNTATGHTSVIFSEESQIPYILQLLAPVRSGALTSVVPTEAATDKYNDMLDERLENSVWTQCASWYRAGARGRIFSTFSGPGLRNGGSSTVTAVAAKGKRKATATSGQADDAGADETGKRLRKDRVV